MTSAQRVAFIGLGAMGLPMASNVARAGLDVVGFDVRQEPLQRLVQAGGKAAHSAHEAAAEADVAIVIPLNAQQVGDALFGPDGVLDGLSRGGTVVVMATIGAQAVREIAASLRERGYACVDAPVTGGAQGAEAGKLTIIAAAADDVLEHVRPVLQPMSRVIHHVGTEPGQGQFVKLLNQLLVGVHIVASSEVVAIAAAAGFPLEKAYDVLCDGFGRSEVFAARVKSVVDGNLKTGGSLGIFLKDLPLAQETASELGVPTFTLASALQYVRLAARALGPSADDAELIAWAAHAPETPEFGRPS
jgi:3-hydroxyisobutyrate dehydrogenase-like beta-hydroxyacid dehydrogenase